LKENLDMGVYRNCVENNLVPRAKVMATHSLKFRNYTVQVEKNAIVAIMKKVYARTDGLRVLPYGHHLNSDRDVCLENRK